ncbi:chain-length determining protein [Pseudomonas sp. C1C7]|uniref:Wzz/FepE/Etk N-terminal domain-containing protein n=1 Tax=Pseudomonas sp. C1C7 TaxID=2735272 RepID=UPI0015860690|nr:Wzz/FepE/Etk N-terminal domain-containing protein [Pseudomonas sp. C1C7]NUT76998.1 chain-length determining protein [Pseudomonas sp. C1C7]
MQDISTSTQGLNELDLYDFIKGVWAQRWLICLVAGLVVVVASLYAFLSPPVYEARAYVSPPNQSDIENLNLGRTKKSELKPYLVKDVYDVFIKNLQSETLKRDFFKSVYLPSLKESDREKSQDVLYRQFLKDLTIIQPVKEFPNRFSILALSGDSAVSVEWLTKYINSAGEMSKNELINNYDKEVEMRARSVGALIQTSRENAANKRKDTLVQLREAEQVADAIGLEKQLTVLGSAPRDISGEDDPRLIYLRGTKALAAEAKVLETRGSDDPYIVDLRRLQGEYDFYKSLRVKSEDIAVYQLDGAIQPPDAPVKPRKALILVLGAVLGLGLGVIAGLIRQFWMRNALRHA